MTPEEKAKLETAKSDKANSEKASAEKEPTRGIKEVQADLKKAEAQPIDVNSARQTVALRQELAALKASK